MASFDTLQKLAENPDWLPPRSDVRVFLGEPGAPEATKTTVEPGNVFSPGMKTFGVTWWVRGDDGAFFATETAPSEALAWCYEGGYLPILHCTALFGRLRLEHSLFQDGAARNRDEAVCARLQVTNTGESAQTAQIFIALRSLGPAGGPLPDLKVSADGCGFSRNSRDLRLLAFAVAPDAVGVGVGDPSPLARMGRVPDEPSAQDAQGWCFGLARFDLALAAGETRTIAFECPQHTYGSLAYELPVRIAPQPEAFEARAAAHRADWERRFGVIGLEVPDPDFRNAFFAGLGHMLTATVGDQARIAPLSYPLPWLRDSVYIIRALDLAGLHEVARAATNYCARNDFFGGFGAEGDAPGQGIWALVEHYRITKDRDWLREVYPAIRRKVDWLFRMRRTTEPIQVTVDTPVLAFTHAMRASGVICLAAQDGIIMGSMDHGVRYALGWVNHWALAGLRGAVDAAHALGKTEDAASFQAEADALQTAYEAFVRSHPEVLREERTVNSLLWPTRAWEDSSMLSGVQEAFEAWWRENRIKGGAFQPEPYWLYFESAQAHNALWMGDPRPAWQVLAYRLAHQDVPGLYGWREGRDGIGTENAVFGVTLINQLRGCQTFESITPHGWSQSELWLLQRAMLVEERGGELVLFSGVPDRWHRPGARIAIRDFPTWYGRVSASLDFQADGGLHLTAAGIHPGTPVRVHVDDQIIRFTANDEPFMRLIGPATGN